MFNSFCFLPLVWNLRNEPVCCSLIQPLSVNEVQLYLDALKLEIPISLLQDVDKICSKSGFCKYPVSTSNCEISQVGLEDEPISNA